MATIQKIGESRTGFLKYISSGNINCKVVLIIASFFIVKFQVKGEGNGDNKLLILYKKCWWSYLCSQEPFIWFLATKNDFKNWDEQAICKKIATKVKKRFNLFLINKIQKEPMPFFTYGIIKDYFKLSIPITSKIAERQILLVRLFCKRILQ